MGFGKKKETKKSDAVEMKHYTVGAAWDSEYSVASGSIDSEKLNLAFEALNSAEEDGVISTCVGEKLYFTIFENKNKKSDNHPDYNITVRIPVSHYPEKSE